MRPLVLRVPSPARPERLDHFLVANLHGLSRRQAKGLIGERQVQVDGRTASRGSLPLRPGQEVAVQYRPSWRPGVADLVPAQILRSETDWWAVDKPPGLPSHRPGEGLRGVPEALLGLVDANLEELSPAHRLDQETSGVLVVARGDALRRWSMRFAEGAVGKEYRAVVSPAPSDDSGSLADRDEAGRSMELSWSILQRSSDGDRAELLVRPTQGRTHQIRIQLSRANWPIIGDLAYGQVLPGGAHRMALHCRSISWEGGEIEAPMPADWRSLLEGAEGEQHTEAPKLRGENHATQGRSPPGPGRLGRRDAKNPDLPKLKVSTATARILRGGHPWVLRDQGTGALDGFCAGDIVDLVDPRDQFVARAALDPQRDLCARVVEIREDRRTDAEAFERRTAAALHKRKALLDDPEQTAYRLVHGESDLLPGIFIDRWGPLLVATWTSRAASAYATSTYKALRQALGPLPLYERDHIEDLRQRSQTPQDAGLPGRWIHEPTEGETKTFERLQVLEGGLCYEVEPLFGLTTGLYPDQRLNRQVACQQVRSGQVHRVANLFGHTGAFSVACAAAGAQETATVDLSRRYLDWARTNFEANSLDPTAHRFVQAGSLEWLQQDSDLWDLMILDPPSHASGSKGAKGWSLKRDYETLVASAARRLTPRGWILACANHKGLRPSWLRRTVESGLRRAGRSVKAFLPAPPSPDFPRKKGFPEGRPFAGFWIQMHD